MWLPHGLAKETSLDAIGPAIQLCCLADPFASLEDSSSSSSSSNCKAQPFDLSRPYAAVLAMRVPGLNPRQRCLLRIKADSKVWLEMLVPCKNR
jgi:hypothetical protein